MVIEDAPRWRSWLDKVTTGGVVVFLLNIAVLAWNTALTFGPEWQAVVYSQSRSTRLYASTNRDIRRCQDAAAAYTSGWETEGGETLQSLCMRRCWPFEGKVRPNAVSEINGECRVVVRNPSPHEDAEALTRALQ